MEDEGWYSAAERYSDFLRRHEETAVLFLELGGGIQYAWYHYSIALLSVMTILGAKEILMETDAFK